ncbi:hypothetical protein AO269_27285 [Pseudomonas putida]|nr:hypothetical protein AO269_27285 [Pseudomonas putida]
MASTKKQDKPSTVPEQATATPGDQALNSPLSGNDATSANTTTGDAAIITPSTDSGLRTTLEEGGPATPLPVEPALVNPSTADATSAGASPSQLGQADDTLEVAADPAAPGEPALRALVEVNPTKVKVYPLRSFMDEGELRRRGGPSYQVPRLHAEELEQRKLVSRTPLEE